MRIDQFHSATQIQNRYQEFVLFWKIQIKRRVERFTIRIQIQRERKELSALSANLLRDIGVDPFMARIESARAFNDIPLSRLNANNSLSHNGS